MAEGNTRYRYYISHALNDGTASQGSRILLELETAVCQRLAGAFDDPVSLAGSVWAQLTHASTAGLADKAGEIAIKLRQRHRPTAQSLISHVRLKTHGLEIDCASGAVAEALGLTLADNEPAGITFTAAVTLTRTGRAMRVVQDNGAASKPLVNASLAKLLVRARRWWRVLREGELDVTTLAAKEGVQPAYVTRVVRLAFLSPAVTSAALEGKLRASVDVGSLTLAGPLPACWHEQAAAMLPCG